ncbi:MAG: hypothetical protein JSV83_24075 [Desulfobacterales bacterium]|nr:MAG: hypothetical protein JSV83_24075 [Desulfobacterales bacterium]
MKRFYVMASASFFIFATLAPMGGAVAQEKKDETGTDPCDFSSKFMPYYRYTELENDVEVNEFVLFGMLAFNPKFAFTYEWPVAKEIDYSSVDAFKQFQQSGIGGDLPPIGNQPGGGGGLPFNDLESDGDVVGMGDLNLRFFYQIDSLRFTFMGGEKDFSIFPVVETTLPTATEDILGGEAWILSPGIVFVFDMPFKSPPLGLGFFASMNFYDFDALKDSSRDHTSRYRGRWFWMQPLSMPAHLKDPEDKGWHVFDLAGLYLLTEFQPIYDFKESDFDFWVGPELGKILRDGYIFYAKPGFGVDNDSNSGDRKFTFELGFRYFFE